MSDGFCIPLFFWEASGIFQEIPLVMWSIINMFYNPLLFFDDESQIYSWLQHDFDCACAPVELTLLPRYDEYITNCLDFTNPPFYD